MAYQEDLQHYYAKLARREPFSESEIAALIKRAQTAETGLAYLAFCQAATLESLPKSASKSARSRHVSLCRMAAEFLDGYLRSISSVSKPASAASLRCSAKLELDMAKLTDDQKAINTVARSLRQKVFTVRRNEYEAAISAIEARIKASGLWQQFEAADAEFDAVLKARDAALAVLQEQIRQLEAQVKATTQDYSQRADVARDRKNEAFRVCQEATRKAKGPVEEAYADIRECYTPAMWMPLEAFVPLVNQKPCPVADRPIRSTMLISSHRSPPPTGLPEACAQRALALAFDRAVAAFGAARLAAALVQP